MLHTHTRKRKRRFSENPPPPFVPLILPPSLKKIKIRNEFLFTRKKKRNNKKKRKNLKNMQHANQVGSRDAVPLFSWGF